MMVSLGAVTRPCHERDEQVRYLAEKRIRHLLAAASYLFED